MSKFLPNSNSITEIMSSLQNRVRALELNKSFIVQKRIQKVEDFGDIVDGYVTLRPNTVYLMDFEGTLFIDFGIRIPENGGNITIQGTLGLGGTQVLYGTPNDNQPLFIGGLNTNFQLYNLTLRSDSFIFELDAGFTSPYNTAPILFLENVSLNGSYRLGLIENYYIVVFNKVIISGITEGLYFNGNFFAGYFSNVIYVDNENMEYYLFFFEGSFNLLSVFKFFACSFDKSNPDGVIFDESMGNQIPDNGLVITDCVFTGTGDYSFFSPSDERVFSKNNFEPQNKVRQLYDTIIAGSYYFSTATATTISIINTWYKIAGTTTISTAERFNDDNTNNRLLYKGQESQKVLINFSGNFIDGAGTPIAQIAIAKNGSIETPTIMRVDLKHSGGADNVSISAILTLDRDDYLEVFIRNTTNTNNITCNFGQMTVIGLT